MCLAFTFTRPCCAVAATTGFCRVWEAAEVLTRLLESDDNTMSGGDEGGDERSLRERVRGRRVVELGSGVGLCGIAAAAAGAHVMLTDLPSVVEAVLHRNIGENRDPDRGGGGDAGGGGGSGGDSVEELSSSTSSAAAPWLGSQPVVGGAGGTATAQVLDWTKSIDKQLDTERRRRNWEKNQDETNDDGVVQVNDPRDADMLLAAECLWLR